MFLRNAACGALWAAGLAMGEQPSRAVEEYAARARVGSFIVAAENLGPSIPNAAGGIYLQDYLVIEAAIFPVGGEKRSTLAQANFGLRVNGSRSVLRPDPPAFVAAAIKYPDWERQREVVAGGQMGNAQVILGRRDPVERFPGDRRPTEQRRPVPNPVPRVDSPVEQKRDDESVERQVRRAALPEGDVALPVAGCLYFPYKGKASKIKTLELVYEGALGAATLRIR